MGDKIAYHPNGDHVITFLEGPHTYTDNYGKRYLSGTSLHGPYFEEFDSASQAVKSSKGTNRLYAGRDPREILAEWEAERLRGSSEGDNVHQYGEAVAAGWDVQDRPSPISDRSKALFVQVDRAIGYLTGRSCRLVFVAAEMIIFSPELLLAGMVDLIMYHPWGTLWVLDWKQNKKITTCNQWRTGSRPLSHLEDTDINKYTLQLSTYQYLIERERYFPHVKEIKRALIHLSETNYKILPLPYFKPEVESMLKALGGKI
ncbi:MAG: PD-(D/E)XK nuclease family protein [Pseudomonadota bacterium]